jgi:hypothetical protein
VPLERELVWSLLTTFFEKEMHRQYPIAGAMAALERLGRIADIVVLTNISEPHQPLRVAQLASHGLHVPVFWNRGGKGPQLSEIVAARQPSVTLFVAEHAPDVWRLHMVGEPEIAPNIEPSAHAHVRIDDWTSAEAWITARLVQEPASAVGISQDGVVS